MFQKDDFRIKQCTEKTLEDFVVVHHEMGHVQYYMNYEDQPTIYREGANPGFHEAIGDLITLSVLTPKHLDKLGLLNISNALNDTGHSQLLEKLAINYQFRMALDKIAFLPFAFIMDKWRWDVFSNSTLLENMNKHWWELRLKYQGISPPVKRSEEDFDPGSKYHIIAGVEYVRYFASHILQFQFFERLCQNVENVHKLHKCDFANNTNAGRELMDLLKKGSSEKWSKILMDFVGTSKMDLRSMKNYFSDLDQLLTEFIDANKIEPGWNYTSKFFCLLYLIILKF